MTTTPHSQKVHIKWNKGYDYGYWSVVCAGKWHWCSKEERAYIRALRRRLNELNVVIKNRTWRPYR